MRGDVTVPAAPFRRIVQDWMDRHVDGDMSDQPMTNAASRTGINLRCLYALMNGERQGDQMPFSQADQIVTRLTDDMGWFSNPELEEIYMSVDLRQQDLFRPLDAPGPIQWAHDTALEAYDRVGTRKAAARELGLGAGVFTALLDDALVAAGRGDEVSVRDTVCVRGHNKLEVGVSRTGYCNACNDLFKERRNAKRRAERIEKKGVAA